MQSYKEIVTSQKKLVPDPALTNYKQCIYMIYYENNLF